MTIMKLIITLLFLPFLYYSQCNYNIIKQDNHVLKQFFPKLITFNNNVDFALSIIQTETYTAMSISMMFREKPLYFEKNISLEFENLSWI